MHLIDDEVFHRNARREDVFSQSKGGGKASLPRGVYSPLPQTWGVLISLA